MQALQIITDFIVSIGHVALIAFCITSFMVLRQMIKDINHLKTAQQKCLMVTMAEHLRSNFNEVNTMRETMQELVENEDFEQAEKLKAVLDKAEADALSALKQFKETFGDDIVEIEATKISRP